MSILRLSRDFHHGLLEIENTRLKKLVADLSLDKKILEETLKGKW